MWTKSPAAIKIDIKNKLLQSLNATEHGARHVGAMAIAKVAAIEVPRSSWPDLFPMLIAAIGSGSAAAVLSGLETLGFVCEELDTHCLQPKDVSAILGQVTQYMKVDGSVAVPTLEAACNAMLNMIDFASGNFSIDTDRDVMMQTICVVGSTGPSLESRKIAFECLSKIVSLYYPLVAPYMQQLFSMTMQAIQKDDEAVALQALDFWSSIAEEEYSLTCVIESEDISDSDSNRITCEDYVKKAKDYLVPILLDCMMKQEDDQDDTMWNVASSAAVCLSKVAQILRNDILELVMPFVNAGLGDGNWRKRDAAVLAFGNILEGPDSEKVFEIVQQALPHFLNVLKTDSNLLVKDSAAWSISSICNHFMKDIPDEHWPTIINQLVERLGDEPNVARKVSDCLRMIAHSVTEDSESPRPSNSISPVFRTVIESLFACAARPDRLQNDLRGACYVAIISWVANAAEDQFALLLDLLNRNIMMLKESVQVDITSDEIRQDQVNLQACLCNCIVNLIRKLGADAVRPLLRDLTSLVLYSFQRNPSAGEEALLLMGQLAEFLEADFVSYMPAFQMFLLRGIATFSSFSLCSMAVSVVGDVCRAIGMDFTMYADAIMQCLLTTLTQPAVSGAIKPSVIAVFSDIAMAIEDNFTKYLPPLVPLLLSVGDVNEEDAITSQRMDDDDFMEYINELNESCLEAFTGIINGLATETNPAARTQLFPFMMRIFEYIQKLCESDWRNDAVTKHLLMMVHDLAEVYGLILKDGLQQEFIRNLLAEGLSMEDDDNAGLGEAAEMTMEKLTAVGIKWGSKKGGAAALKYKR